MKKNKPRENYVGGAGVSAGWACEGWKGWMGAYESAGEVDACGAGACVVQPVWLGKAEEAAIFHCCGNVGITTEMGV